MPTIFAFSETRIKALKPPTDKDREYHKDKTYPGLQVCVTSAGSKTYYLVKRTDGRPTRHLLGTADELSVDQARKAASAKAGKIATGENPQTERRRKREEPTLEKLHAHWMLYANAHKKPVSATEDKRIFEKLCSGLAKRRLGTIKKADIQALHSTIGTDNGIYAANRTLALLRAMFNIADEIGYRGDNPAKGVKMFKEESRDRFLQPGELEAFFTALEAEPEIFRDYFLTLLLTGARKNNVMMMRWADLDLTAGYLANRGKQERFGGGGAPRCAGGCDPGGTERDLQRPRMGISRAARGDHMKEPDKSWARIIDRAKLADLRIHDLRRSLGFVDGRPERIPDDHRQGVGS